MKEEHNKEMSVLKTRAIHMEENMKKKINHMQTELNSLFNSQ